MRFDTGIVFSGLKVVNYLINEFVDKRRMRAMSAFCSQTMLQIVGNKVKNHNRKNNDHTILIGIFNGK